jgi:hypothetical protein
LGTRYTVFEPRCSELTFGLDRPWLEQNNLDISAVRFPPSLFRDIALFDGGQSAVSNLELVLRQEIEIMKEQGVDRKHVVHTFEPPTFLGPEFTGVSYVKVDAVSVNIEIQTTHVPLRFDASKFVQFVLREVTSGGTHLLLKPRK